MCLRAQYWARPYFSFLSSIFRFISKSAPLICMQMTRRFTRMVKINKMNVHMTKTTCMLVGARKLLNDYRPLNIIADHVNIQSVSKQKLLGVYIDEHLSWSAHIDHLCSLISCKISLLRQLATYVPTHIQKVYYQGYILPYIDYGSVTCGVSLCN